MPMFYGGIHWDPTPTWNWQVTNSYVVRVDVTSHFDAAFRITAVNKLSDEEGESLREKIRASDIQTQRCGQNGIVGNDPKLFDYISHPIDGSAAWTITNNGNMSPGQRQEISWGQILPGDAISDHMAKSPTEQYAVQFESVPWYIMKRYWRKPIGLKRGFHGPKFGGMKHGYRTQAVSNVLQSDKVTLELHKTFLADFSYIWVCRTPCDTTKWMVKNIKAFCVLTDQSPFVKAEDEIIFSLDRM